MEQPISIRIRSSTAKGNYKVELGSANSLLEDLVGAVLVQEEILQNGGELVNLQESHPIEEVLAIKKGFPPKPLAITKETLSSPTGLKHNDAIIVEILLKDTRGWRQSVSLEGGFTQAKVPSDGSCLFNAITLGLEDRIDKSDELRGTVAAIILSDPAKYTQNYLGKEPGQYCEWICQPGNWGGIPELKILSEHFQTQIGVIDIGDAKIHRFGAEGGYPKHIYLMYDGTHYNLGVQGPTKVFSSTQDQAPIEEGLLKLAKQLKDNGEYIDPNLFQLKCVDCGTPMQGQIDAVEHAKLTGHQNFTQVEGADIFTNVL